VTAALTILLVGDYPPDPTLGSPKVFYKLQEEFAALGHSCELLLGPDIALAGSRQLRQLVTPSRAARAIARRLAARRYDVVDAASAEGWVFGAQRKAGKHARVAYVCRSNGLEHLNYSRMLEDAAAGLTRKPWTRRIWYPLSRLTQVAAAARLADRLLLLNDADRAFALHRGWKPADRIDVIPHGVSSRFLEATPEDYARGEGLLFCANWDHMKGIHYLVEGFVRIHDAGFRIPLTIVGAGHSAETVLAAFPAALRPFVRVIPKLQEAELMEQYRRHDVLLWTSTYEGFGLVLLEAMSQRMAVISTPVGCAGTLIQDGRNGVLIPARDAAALAGSVARLLSDKGLRQRLGAAARSTVAELSWRRCAAETIACYRAAIHQARG